MALIHLTEAAERIGVNRQTLINYGKKGALRLYRIGKGAFLIDENTVNTLADTMADVQHARDMLDKEREEVLAELEKERELMRDLRSDILSIDKCRQHFVSKRFYYAIVDMLKIYGDFRDRECNMMRSVIDGESIADVAERHSISLERARQILAKFCRRAGELAGIKEQLDDYKQLKEKAAEMKIIIEALKKENVELKGIKAAQEQAEWINEERKTKYPDPLMRLLTRPIIDCNFSIRTLNCLNAAGIECLCDLVQYKSTDLLKFRNFGRKSVAEVEEFLEQVGLNLGMDINELYDITLKQL